MREGKILVSDICRIVRSVWNKEELCDHRDKSLISQICNRAIKLTLAIIVGYRCHQLNTRSYPISFSQI
jgi:hypothetical protein